MDDEDPIIGFSQHPILFAVRLSTLLPFSTDATPGQALRHFAVSPSNGVDAASNTSTKDGYARQCNVKHVTVESIVEQTQVSTNKITQILT